MGGEKERRQEGLPNLSGEVALGNQRTDRKVKGSDDFFDQVLASTGHRP